MASAGVKGRIKGNLEKGFSMNCVLRKFIIGKLNDFLEMKQEDVAKAKNLVELWNTRAQKVSLALQSLLQKLDDGKVDEEEIEQAVDEIRRLVGEWK
jgi:endonuclease III